MTSKNSSIPLFSCDIFRIAVFKLLCHIGLNKAFQQVCTVNAKLYYGIVEHITNGTALLTQI